MPFEKNDPRIPRTGRPKGYVIGPKRRIGTVTDTLEKSGKNPVRALWQLYESAKSDKTKKEILQFFIQKCEDERRKKTMAQIDEIGVIDETPKVPEEPKDLVAELEKSTQEPVENPDATHEG